MNYYRNGSELEVTPMSHAEEKALFAKARAGDDAAKETIIKNHLMFAASLGRSLSKGRLPDDEVVSAANYALMLAYENFDPRFPNRFAAFIRSHVRGAIARLWSEKNLVNKSNFDDGPVSTCEILETDIVEEHPFEEEEHHKFLLALSEQAKNVLDEREAKIFNLLYPKEGIKLSQAEVARKLGFSRERIRQLTNDGLEKLKRELRRLMNLHGIN